MFRFVSFRFVSLRWVSFHFISLRFILISLVLIAYARYTHASTHAQPHFNRQALCMRAMLCVPAEVPVAALAGRAACPNVRRLRRVLAGEGS